MKIKLRDVRISWPVLFVPENMRGETDPKKRTFGLSAIIPPDSPHVQTLDDAMLAAAREKFPDTDKVKDRGQKMLKQLIEKGDVFFFKKENANDAGEPYAGFEGQFFMRARSSYKNPPTVRDKDASKITEDTGRIYSGCFCNLVLDVWGQDNSKGFGNRINCTLLGVQFFRDGDSFGGGQKASDDDFEDLSDTGEGEDFEDLT